MLHRDSTLPRFVFADHGDDVEPVVRMRFHNNGDCYYEVVDQVDIQEYISSYEAGSSLTSMLNRCNMLPVNEKVRYLSQVNDKVYADLTNFPTDGTALQMFYRSYLEKNPEFANLIRNGESFESALKKVFVSDSSKSNAVNSEVNNNGSNE